MPECEEEEEEPEPCDTGNEVLDNPSFQELKRSARDSSGLEKDESERLEGFWAVYENNGVFTKQMLPFSSRTSCTFSISFGTVSNMNTILDGAVFLLHTHPYAPRDPIHDTACHEAQKWDVETDGSIATVWR